MKRSGNSQLQSGWLRPRRQTSKTRHATIKYTPKQGSKRLVSSGNIKISEEITKALAGITGANELTNVVDLVDFNSDEKLGKEQKMVDRLTKLIAIFESLDFNRNY